MISLCTIILKFVQIPWPNGHMNNLEEFLDHVLTIFILLHKNTHPSLKKVRRGIKIDWISRSSQQEVFRKTSGLQLFLKKRLWHRCFPVNFEKFLRTPFLTEHLRWLLLDIELFPDRSTLHEILSFS